MPTVDLSVGHGVRPDGTHDPGATAAGGSPSEQTAGDVIVAHSADVLEQHGVEVLANESYTDDPNYEGSIERINADPLPDLAVTVHHDWRGAPRGTFCHWFEGSPAKRAADAVFDFAREHGFPRRPDWHKPRNELDFLNGTKVPALLVEADRIGSLSDAELVQYGELLARAILHYFGMSYMRPEEREVDFDVVIIYKPNSPDDVAARTLALEHIFRLLPLGTSRTFGHAILFGSAAQHRDSFDVPTTIFAGANRDKTADFLVDATGNGPSREREHPTVEDLKRGQA